jgi:hypothetical protein
MKALEVLFLIQIFRVCTWFMSKARSTDEISRIDYDSAPTEHHILADWSLMCTLVYCVHKVHT